METAVASIWFLNLAHYSLIIAKNLDTCSKIIEKYIRQRLRRLPSLVASTASIRDSPTKLVTLCNHCYKRPILKDVNSNKIKLIRSKKAKAMTASINLHSRC